MENLLEDISFNAGGNHPPIDVVIDAKYVREHLGELDPGKPVYVMCQSGLRSYLACRILAQHGFTCYNFAGGYRFYEAVTTDRRQSDAAFACGMDK